MSLPTRTIGKNGPEVAGLGSGLMSLGHAYGHAGSDEERFNFLDKACELGATNWDCADIYGDTEELLGKWFKRSTGNREKVFLATKFGFLSDLGTVRSDPDYVKSACDESLRKLGVDHIDLYYCHRVDKKTPIEKTVEAMAELKRQGKIKYLGLSEVSSDTLRRAHAVHPISAVQVEYSPFVLDIEDPKIGLLNTCRELGVSIVAYCPLGRGFLTGTIKSRDDIKGDYREFWPRFSEENFHKNLILVDQIKAIAERRKITSAQATLAFLLAQGPDIIPIPGTKRIVALEENMAALKIVLSAEEIAAIRKAAEAAVPAGDRYPEAMMDSLFADTPPLT